MGIYTSGGIGRDVLAGAAAGIAAIWVADKLDQAMYRAGGLDSIRKTEAARPGGMDPAHVLAKRAADAIGADIGDPKDNPAGHTIHYGFAAGIGALYGLLRGISPTVSTGRGALFGLAAFVLKDEVGNAAMGTAGPALSYPIRDHARGAATHTLFGFVTDLVTRVLSPWRDEVVIEQGMPWSERLERGRDDLARRRDTLYAYGQQNLDRGREMFGRGMASAGQWASTARARLPEVDTAALSSRGQAYVGQAVKTMRSVPDYVQAYVPDHVPDYVTEIPTSGFSRAMQRLFG